MPANFGVFALFPSLGLVKLLEMILQRFLALNVLCKIWNPKVIFPLIYFRILTLKLGIFIGKA